MTSTSDDEITNADRVERCQQALENYNDAWDVRSNLIDLLTDVRHWCDANCESYAELDRIAYQHYAAEAAAEREART
jgi:hypothetical protein